MRLIVDTNIIISALVKDGLARAIMNNNLIEFHAPDYAINEVNKHMDEIIKKSKLDKSKIDLLFSLLMQNVDIVPEEIIKPKIDGAISIMKNVDINDAPILACALAIPNDGIWTEDKHLEKQNKAKVWKTRELISYR